MKSSRLNSYRLLQAVHIVLGVSLGAPFAFASPSASPSGSDEAALLTSVSAENGSNTKLNLGLAHESLFLRESPPGGHSDETRFGVRLRSQSSLRSNWGGVFDASGSFAAGPGRENDIEVPQAFASYSNAPLSDTRAWFAAGRKLESWSQLDSDWSQGLWQPLNRFDGLRTSEQGLVGFFAGYRKQSFEILAFASPVFIPEQGPGFHLENGHFNSSNPWFSEPTDRLILFGQNTSIRYDIEMPSAQSVIKHPSGGLLLRFGSPSDPGSSVQAAFIKKPRNQLALPFDGMLNITHDQAQVTIVPEVVYHNLASLDVSYRADLWSFGVSSLADISDAQDIPQGLTYQRFEPLYMVSPWIETRVFANRPWGPWLKLSVLESFGGQTVMMGPLSTDKDPFAPRVMYKRAASFDVRSQVWQRGTLRVEQTVRWIEEFLERGTVVMLDTALVNREKWRVSAYVDVLASRQAEDVNPGFISRYRGNDRAGAVYTLTF